MDEQLKRKCSFGSKISDESIGGGRRVKRGGGGRRNIIRNCLNSKRSRRYIYIHVDVRLFFYGKYSTDTLSGGEEEILYLLDAVH